jgi:hypothetical protein
MGIDNTALGLTSLVGVASTSCGIPPQIRETPGPSPPPSSFYQVIMHLFTPCALTAMGICDVLLRYYVGTLSGELRIFPGSPEYQAIHREAMRQENQNLLTCKGDVFPIAKKSKDYLFAIPNHLQNAGSRHPTTSLGLPKHSLDQNMPVRATLTPSLRYGIQRR